ncbi:hypothetical protein V8J39_18735 [Frigidibacter sp. MR17.24]
MSDASLWSPSRTGVWRRDNAQGRELADALEKRMTETNNPSLLGWTVKAIIDGGIYDGVEVGFCQRVAERAIYRAEVA